MSFLNRSKPKDHFSEKIARKIFREPLRACPFPIMTDLEIVWHIDTDTNIIHMMDRLEEMVNEH